MNNWRIETLQAQRERQRRWRGNNREHLRAYFRKYRAEHPEIKMRLAKWHQEKGRFRRKPLTEAQKANRREWDAKNRDKLRANRRLRAIRDREREREISKRSRAKNRLTKRLKDAEYRRQKPELYKASIARAKAAKPELYREISVNSALARRARRRQAVTERISIRKIRKRDKDLCHLCGGAVARDQLSLDHLIPVIRQGAHAEWNLMVAHLRCNKIRGIKQLIFPENRESAEAYICSRNAAASLAA